MDLPDNQSSLWPLLTVVATLAAGLLGVIAGYALSLWRNRLLPWITVHSFGTTVASNDIVVLQPDLVAASEASWMTVALTSPARLTTVQGAFNASTLFLQVHADSATTAAATQQRLRAATTLEETRTAVLPMLLHDGIRELFIAAIWRDLITIPAINPPPPNYLAYDLRADIDGGSFVIDFPNNRVAIGSDLNSR